MGGDRQHRLSGAAPGGCFSPSTLYKIVPHHVSKMATRPHPVHIVHIIKQLLGIWITEDLSWAKNTKEICKKAYFRISMLSKLKHVGTSTEDLIDIYVLFIRSCAKYCSVAFHSSLTKNQALDIERIQKTSLRIILSEMYVDYPIALEMCNLKPLFVMREKK